MFPGLQSYMNGLLQIVVSQIIKPIVSRNKSVMTVVSGSIIRSIISRRVAWSLLKFQVNNSFIESQFQPLLRSRFL